MGHARRRPSRLAEKLLQIRTALGLSQTEMHRRLDVGDEIPYTRISDYELDKSEPTLMILLSYARLAGVPTEVLIDDELDLPDKLPGPTDHEEIKRKFSRRGRRR
jgi:transcriptional regulator with XRE-family HTH domain